MQELIIIQPDDWHIHLRDGAGLARTVDDVSRIFARTIVMPNLSPPATKAAAVMSYRDRILAALPSGRNFEPLMVLYLTDNTSAEDIREAAANPYIHAAKLYPAGATTNSDSGVTDVKKIYPALTAMEEYGIKLLIHGEVTDNHIDIYDRERVFIETILGDIVDRYPKLKIVFEHITTKDAVDFVINAPANVGATITPQHLLYNRNDMLASGIRPHYFCLPILKRNIHQQALIAAAISGNQKFFLGTDSAPHTKNTKEAACGCAGCYTSNTALELYAQIFEDANALDKLEAFASFNGPDFYNLPRNTAKVKLSRQSQVVPASLDFAGEELVPLLGGQTISWQAELI
ncbi:MAG: dihydroorotase [Chitinophagales bacterium]|jgi:dihydroorotase